MKTKLNTIKTLSKGLVVLMLTGGLFSVNAQENQPKSIIGVNADGYQKFDVGRVNNSSKTYFTEAHNSYEIGMISLDYQQNVGKINTFIDLGAGKRADKYSSNDKNTEIFIKQAYVSYNINEDLYLTAGTWKKHVGYEQINVVDNNNYSMSYAFTNTNFFNTGLKLNYKIEKFGFMIGIGNATDFKSAIDVGLSKKNYFGQFSYNASKTKISYGFQTIGIASFPSNAIQNDIIIEHKFTDKISGAINFTNYNYKADTDTSWNSGSAYLKYNFNEKLYLSYRGEYFNSNDRLKNLLKQNYMGANIISNTITGNYKIGKLSLIPEIRVDHANEKIFFIDGKSSKTNVFFLIGTTYKF